MDNSGGANDSPLKMQLELENVQNVIQLTKEYIDALNERFSKFKPSPKIYLEEYQDLTSKLHQLKTMEQNLVEKMQSIQEQNEVSEQFHYEFSFSQKYIFFRWNHEHCFQRSSQSFSLELICQINRGHQFKW